METKEIQYEIWKRRPEVSMASIGRQVGVSTQAVQQTVTRKIKSARIAQGIADAIERPLEEVFPELAEGVERRRARAIKKEQSMESQCLKFYRLLLDVAESPDAVEKLARRIFSGMSGVLGDVDRTTDKPSHDPGLLPPEVA